MKPPLPLHVPTCTPPRAGPRPTARQATAPGARIQFDKVVALRSDGQFVRGRPYLANVLVEGMLVEEFAAPAANSENAPSPPQLGKVLVTRIRHSEESLRLLEEAFLGLQA